MQCIEHTGFMETVSTRKLCKLQTPSIEVIELLTKRSLSIFLSPPAAADFSFIISNFISHQINEVSKTRKPNSAIMWHGVA